MPKKKYPENIQKLKENLEIGNNLVEYFVICGVPPSICQKEELFNTSNNYLENVNKILKPEIICKFPEFDYNNLQIDEAIIRYCFPEGFKVLENKNSPHKKSEIFSVILDNSLVSSEYPQKYLICLLFYERITDYLKLKNEIEKVNNSSDNIDNFKNINPNNNVIDSIKNAFEPGKHLSHNRNLMTSVLPSFQVDKNDEGEQIILPYEDSNSIKRNSIKYQGSILKNYYIPKCICLVSIHPYIKLYQKILSNIYNYAISPHSKKIPLEKIITNLIVEVPTPPRGLYLIKYNYLFNNIVNLNSEKESQEYSKTQPQNDPKDNSNNSKSQIPTLRSTENDKLLITEIDLKKFNDKMSFNCKMEVIKNILFDNKILFFSINVNNLCETILAFQSLIFPFKYPFQISSLLHKENYGILQSPSPYIIGINEEYDPNFFEENELMVEGMNILVVDLDNKKDGKNYNLFTDEEFPEFPSKLINNLEKEIKSLVSNINTINDNNSNPPKDRIRTFNELYQEKFFHFFCEILKGYEDYLNLDFFKSSDNEKGTSIETLFNCDKFIKSIHSQADIPFYNKFIKDAQMFSDFIYKRMIPKNNSELMDILLVNDYIKKKIKYKGKDEEQNKYQISNVYSVDYPRELTEREISDILSGKEEFIKYGQIIEKSQKDPNKLLFDYILFPMLDFNLYCNIENVNQFNYPQDYSEEIDAINSEVISQSSIGQNMNRALEMKNYIYLTWLEVWAFTFSNNELKERHYRFDQMLDVLDKVIHHEMNILNLLFNILNKHGEPQMMLKLYQKLLQLKINPSTFIFGIISNVLDKNQIKELTKTKSGPSRTASTLVGSKEEILEDMKKNSGSAQLKFNDYEVKNNRKRTFLSITDNLSLETKPKFYYDYYCIYCINNCPKKINLYNTCKNFEGTKNDILWVHCSQCGEYNLPKINVKFGLDFLISQNHLVDFVLHSPYNLMINIKNAVVTHYGTDINILNFKTQFQPLFWNFIWYCVIHNLDYNILLPYCNNLEQKKEANCRNPNREIFKADYDNSKFQENQDKIQSTLNKIKRDIFKNKINKFENLKQCSRVSEVACPDTISKKEGIKREKEVEKKENKGKKEVKEVKAVKEDKEDIMSKTTIYKKPKISLFDFLDKGKDNQKKEEKNEEKKKAKKEENNEAQMIKEVEKYNQNFFPTSW